jgi:hypothetical protein
MHTILACIVVAALALIIASRSRRQASRLPPLLKASPTSIDEILAQSRDVDVLIALHQKMSQKCAASGFNGLSEAEKVVLCVEDLEGEVNNGGFHQYFLNSDGELIHETPAALEAIGAGYTAAIVRRACSVFPEGSPPKDRTERQESLLVLGREADAQLSRLDDEFYAYKDDLSRLVIDYA